MKPSRFEIFFYIVVAVLIILLVATARAQEQSSTNDIQPSGGTFKLEKTVIAGGGSQSAQRLFNQTGTTGQTAAGSRSTGGNFAVYSGFWTPGNFAPTAANVIVGGRAKTADGRGIRNVSVTITFPSGEQRIALSETFGYYRFAEIPAGATYIFTASAKRFSFNSPTQTRNVADDVQDIDFIADAPPQTANAGAEGANLNAP